MRSADCLMTKKKDNFIAMVVEFAGVVIINLKLVNIKFACERDHFIQ